MNKQKENFMKNQDYLKCHRIIVFFLLVHYPLIIQFVLYVESYSIPDSITHYQYHGVDMLVTQLNLGFVLLTDNEQAKRKFYEKSGLFEVSQNNCLGFMKLNTN